MSSTDRDEEKPFFTNEEDVPDYADAPRNERNSSRCCLLKTHSILSLLQITFLAFNICFLVLNAKLAKDHQYSDSDRDILAKAYCQC